MAASKSRGADLDANAIYIAVSSAEVELRDGERVIREGARLRGDHPLVQAHRTCSSATERTTTRCASGASRFTATTSTRRPLKTPTGRACPGACAMRTRSSLSATAAATRPAIGCRGRTAS